MSTIAVARKGTSVSIGADTLVKDRCANILSKYRIDDPKIIRVGESLISLIGDAAWGHVFPSALDSLPQAPTFSSPESIFETLRELHPILRDQYFLRPCDDDDDEFVSSEHTGLIANPSGIYGIFSSRSVIEYSRFFALGAGWEYALGAMYAAYDRVDTAQEVVRLGLEAAAEFDEDTAAPFELHELELDGAQTTIS